MRPPRGFGPDRHLRIYDMEKAIGQGILRTIDEHRYSNDWHLFHSITSDEMLVIVSNKNVLLINVKERQMIWRIGLEDVIDVSNKSTTCVIDAKQRSNYYLSGLKTLLFTTEYGQSESRVSQSLSFGSPSDAEWFSQRLHNIILRIKVFVNDVDDLAFSVDVSSLDL